MKTNNSLDSFTLLSGVDIPFISARLTVHQPTLKEIGYIGVENFYSGCGFLTFSKDNLSEQDRNNLKEVEDFDILMSMMTNKKNIAFRTQCLQALNVLTILFPSYQIKLEEDRICFIKENEDDKYLTAQTFPYFREIISAIFCLGGKKEDKVNPGGEMARKIAEKLKQRQQKLSELKSSEGQMDIFSRYVSILSVGLNMSPNTLLDCTIYQLFDLFERYVLWSNNDIYIRAQMAGAKDLQKVEDWMKDFNSK